MQQKQMPDRYGQKTRIYHTKYLLVGVSFLIFSLLPGVSGAPQVSERNGRRAVPRPLQLPEVESLRGLIPKGIEDPTRLNHSGSAAAQGSVVISGHDHIRIDSDAKGDAGLTLTPYHPIRSETQPYGLESVLQELGYSGVDAQKKFQSDFGIKEESTIGSAAQAILETHRNGVSLASNAILYTVFPGKILGSSSRYLLVDNDGKLVNKNDNIQTIRESINYEHEQDVYLDVTRFDGDRRSALVYSLEFGNIAEGKAYFRLITCPEMIESLFSPKLSLEIPKDDAIVVENGRAEVTIRGATFNKKSFILTLRAKTEKALRAFLDYFRTIVDRLSSDLGLVGMIELARHDFAKRYPHDDIEAEVRVAAGAIQIVDYIDAQKRADYSIASLKSGMQKLF